MVIFECVEIKLSYSYEVIQKFNKLLYVYSDCKKNVRAQNQNHDWYKRLSSEY